jgi:hypothetical protein
MKLITFFATVLFLSSQAAFAESADGSGALALAALAAAHSPSVNARDKSVLKDFLNGETNVSYPPQKKITVAADAVTCRASNVDITAHSCDLTFGSQKAAIQGAKAHELYAALIEVHAEQDAGPGTVFAAVSKLICIIDPAGVKAKDGSGAHCEFAGART